MIRSMLLCCILLATGPSTHAQEAKPLGTLALDLGRLKDWGTKTYTYEASQPGSSEKTIMGRVVLKTEMADNAILLTDHFEIEFRAKKLTLDLAHQCKKDNFLSPVRIDSKGEGDDEFGTFVATIDEEGATIRSDGRERKMELPKNVVTWSAFFRLVTLLPRQEGSRISYPYSLESEELNLKKDFMVECLGADIVQSGKEGVTCTKFRLTGGGNNPAYYWVDDDGVLRRVLIDERKLIRLTGQRAQPGKPAPEGDVAQLAAVVVVGVTQRNPLFPDGFTVGGLTIGRLAGQVVQGFGEEILFDEPLVRQGEGRIFREDRMTVAATETHAPGRYDFDDELVELRIEHADAELPPGAVVLGEGRGKRQQGQAARRQRNVLFTTAWLYSLTSRRASLMLVLLL
jgi:hypothetical protein